MLTDYIKSEKKLIFRKPLAFASFVLVGAVIGYSVGTTLSSREIAAKDAQIMQLNGLIAGRDDQLRRYRVALSIDEATKGNLIELTDAELWSKAQSTAAALREFEVGTRHSIEAARRASSDPAAASDAVLRVTMERSDEYERKLKADATNVDSELRRRLDPAAVSSIVGISQSVRPAGGGTPISITNLMPSGMGISSGFVGTVADGIDRMARLLPVLQAPTNVRIP